ncbi:hypothetical protein C8T65DRAFT_684813 [Cerioporus squamosus]|nr:hypothetical protein C8T65DRAFT_684813 [Cerioporus squamosus]
MITVSRKVPRVSSTSMIREVLAFIEDDWGVIPVAVTTDCSGESRAARSAIVAERPQLVGPDCYAHQIQRVIVDYFKAANTTNIFVYAKLADKVIKTLRSRTYLLALLRDIQEVELAGLRHNPRRLLRA